MRRVNDTYKYMVATHCMTYNHGRYIEATLHGFVLQETTFPIVYIVVDDASKDGEPEVLRRWAQDNLMPDEKKSLWSNLPYGQIAEGTIKGREMARFVILLLSENHFSQGKDSLKFEYIANWSKFAKYIALCEGDDYWNDPLKLQDQVKALEENPSAGLCYTNAVVFDDGSQLFEKPFPHPFENVRTLLYHNPIMTLTTLFKSDLFYQYRDTICPEKHQWKLGDYPIWIWMAYYSDVIYIDKVTSVYRKLSESASHSSSVKKNIEFIESINDVRQFYLERFFHNDKELEELVREDRLIRLAKACDQADDRIGYINFTKQRRSISYRTRIRLFLSSNDMLYHVLKRWEKYSNKSK